jgi:cytochrome P450
VADPTRHGADGAIALFGPDMLPDPYPTYRRLRETAPVYWSVPLDAWVLTRYDDVDAALRDLRFSSTFGDLGPPAVQEGHADAAGQQALSTLYRFVANSLVFSDPPNHTRLRELVAKAFTPRAIEALHGQIQALVDELLGAVAAQHQMDLVPALAYPLPLAVIGGMLGIPRADHERVKGWCDDFLVPFGRDLATLTPDDRVRVEASSTALVQYARGLVEAARAHPRDDLISGLVQAATAGDKLSEDELFATVVLFIIAGHENLTSLLGVGTLALLRNPDELARPRADPSLWPKAVEELVRYVTPNQFIRRRAKEAVTLGGQTIQPEQGVILVLAAANRDPAHFPDPERLDLTRQAERHLAFGHGFHYCIGAWLARLEAEIAWRTLFERFPTLRLATDHWEYQDNFNVRQLRALPLAY